MFAKAFAGKCLAHLQDCAQFALSRSADPEPRLSVARPTGGESSSARSREPSNTRVPCEKRFYRQSSLRLGDRREPQAIALNVALGDIGRILNLNHLQQRALAMPIEPWATATRSPCRDIACQPIPKRPKGQVAFQSARRQARTKGYMWGTLISASTFASV